MTTRLAPPGREVGAVINPRGWATPSTSSSAPPRWRQSAATCRARESIHRILHQRLPFGRRSSRSPPHQPLRGSCQSNHVNGPLGLSSQSPSPSTPTRRRLRPARRGVRARQDRRVTPSWKVAALWGGHVARAARNSYWPAGDCARRRQLPRPRAGRSAGVALGTPLRISHPDNLWITSGSTKSPCNTTFTHPPQSSTID